MGTGAASYSDEGLFGDDESLLHYIVPASRAFGGMTEDVFGDGRVATGDDIEQIVESDFGALGCAMFAARHESLSF